ARSLAEPTMADQVRDRREAIAGHLAQSRYVCARRRSRDVLRLLSSVFGPLLPYGLAMAVGWAQDGAVQDQIDATVDSVRRCVPCQSEADRLDVHQSLYNRRGSKDSQLK